MYVNRVQDNEMSRNSSESSDDDQGSDEGSASSTTEEEEELEWSKPDLDLFHAMESRDYAGAQQALRNGANVIRTNHLGGCDALDVSL